MIQLHDFEQLLKNYKSDKLFYLGHKSQGAKEPTFDLNLLFSSDYEIFYFVYNINEFDRLIELHFILSSVVFNYSEHSKNKKFQHLRAVYQNIDLFVSAKIPVQYWQKSYDLFKRCYLEYFASDCDDILTFPLLKELKKQTEIDCAEIKNIPEIYDLILKYYGSINY